MIKNQFLSPLILLSKYLRIELRWSLHSYSRDFIDITSCHYQVNRMSGPKFLTPLKFESVFKKLKSSRLLKQHLFNQGNLNNLLLSLLFILKSSTHFSLKRTSCTLLFLLFLASYPNLYFPYRSLILNESCNKYIDDLSLNTFWSDSRINLSVTTPISFNYLTN